MMEQNLRKCPWIGWPLRSPLRASDFKFQRGILWPIPGSDNRGRGRRGNSYGLWWKSKVKAHQGKTSYVWPCTVLSSRQWPSCPTGTCHDSSQLDESMRALQETPTALTLTTVFYTCSSLRFAFLKLWARWHVLGRAFDECVPCTLLTQQRLP